MRAFDANEYVCYDVADAIAVNEHLLYGIELEVDDVGRVWTESGHYVADAISASEVDSEKVKQLGACCISYLNE